MSALVDSAWIEADFARLETGVQHVWLIDLDSKPAKSTVYLSPDEVSRASRYRFERDRDHFETCRTALRSLLGKYLDSEPAFLEIETGPNGKPHLAGRHRGLMHFNVSHSGGYALIAVSLDEIGVDIEYHDPQFIESGTLSICMSGRERSVFDLLNPETQVQTFFDTWTAKEAYLKLIGDGLAIEPSLIDLGSASCASSGATIGGGDIHFNRLPEIRGYSAAIATYYPPIAIRTFRF